MIEQIQKFNTNTLAFEINGGFDEADEKLAQKLFQEKLKEGFEHVNVIFKLDEMKLSQTSTKAFMEDIIWAIRNFKHIGNIAIVAHSKILKALVPIDNFFFERLQNGYEERYFDATQLDKAIAFVNAK